MEINTNVLLQVKGLISDISELLEQKYGYKLADKYIDANKIIINFEDILMKKERKSENE